MMAATLYPELIEIILKEPAWVLLHTHNVQTKKIHLQIHCVVIIHLFYLTRIILHLKLYIEINKAPKIDSEYYIQCKYSIHN